MLNDGVCIDLARALRRRGVPFLFLSANHPGEGMPADLLDVPWLEKPVTYDRLLDGFDLSDRSKPQAAHLVDRSGAANHQRNVVRSILALGPLRGRSLIADVAKAPPVLLSRAIRSSVRPAPTLVR